MMAYTITLMPDVPCIYTKYIDLLSDEDLSNANSDMVALRHESFHIDDKVYVLADYRESRHTTAQTFKNLNVVPSLMGNFSENNMEMIIIIGLNSTWLMLAERFLNRMKITFKTVEDVEEGIAYIQSQRAK